MIIINSLLLSIAFIMWSAVIDREHIEKKQYIDNHKSRWMQRICFFGVFTIYDVINGFASALLFTALFDQFLNFERRLPFWYLGTVSKWDIFFSKRKWMYISIKIISLILSLCLFFLY